MTSQGGEEVHRRGEVLRSVFRQAEDDPGLDADSLLPQQLCSPGECVLPPRPVHRAQGPCVRRLQPDLDGPQAGEGLRVAA